MTVAAPESAADAMARARANTGETLLDISRAGPTLVVFLRHFGCTFCREAAADIAARRAEIEGAGARLAFVHTGPERDAPRFFERYGLADAPRVPDPDGSVYEAFGLRRGSLGQLFGLKVWLRGVRAGLLDRHLVGKLSGDGFRMPGVFLVRDGEVVRAFRHETAADRPDYCALAATP